MICTLYCRSRCFESWRINNKFFFASAHFMVKQNDPVETELPLDDKVDNNVGNDIAVPISNDGNTTEDNVNAGNEKEGTLVFLIFE